MSKFKTIVNKILSESSNNYGIDIDALDDKLVITLNDRETKVEIRDMVKDKGLGYAEFEILGDFTGFGNNGATITSGDQIGQGTEALFVLYDGKAYTDMNYYQIRSYVDDLLNNGRAELSRVTEWSEEDVIEIENKY